MAISIHALREEGDMTARATIDRLMISIHALREEGDRPKDHAVFYGIDISIHALREEGDSRYPGVMRKFHYFYPRPPRGGRHPLAAATPPDN